MIVRCGRCRAEIDVSGPGEFLCPSCGTRNAVRAASTPEPVLDLGGGSMPAAAPPPEVRWVVCPSCSYRFVIGDVPEVGCPTCSARLEVTADSVRLSGA